MYAFIKRILFLKVFWLILYNIAGFDITSVSSLSAYLCFFAVCQGWVQFRGHVPVLMVPVRIHLKNNVLGIWSDAFFVEKWHICF